MSSGVSTGGPRSVPSMMRASWRWWGGRRYTAHSTALPDTSSPRPVQRGTKAVCVAYKGAGNHYAICTIQLAPTVGCVHHRWARLTGTAHEEAQHATPHARWDRHRGTVALLVSHASLGRRGYEQGVRTQKDSASATLGACKSSRPITCWTSNSVMTGASGCAECTYNVCTMTGRRIRVSIAVVYHLSHRRCA